MATFVLVHGGWGGGWEWRFVANFLAERGHEVYRPTLTGLGERRHLGRPETDLDTHIQDVVAVLETEELTSVILAGQSYGGAVITGVVDRVPERIARVVYLDAFVPRAGETVNELSGPRFAGLVRQGAEERGDGWQAPLPLTDEQIVDGMPAELQAWYLRHIGPHPLQTLEQPFQPRGGGGNVPRTYVSHRPDGIDGTWIFDQFEQRAREDGWDVRELRVGHDAQVIAPDRLAAMLDEIAVMPPAPASVAG
ncbi:MAG TPA: alpha/beta hydrolase [Candidatus Limnocylindrales bacterium]|nr:alpha/beta hydrolase [Candidatus Limnocylindrales bacterium]